MFNQLWNHKVVLAKLVLGLALSTFVTMGHLTPAFAQVADTSFDEGVIEVIPVSESGDESSDSSKVSDYFATGESSSYDDGKAYIHLPFVITGNIQEVQASEVQARWRTVFRDEFINYPSGWIRWNNGSPSTNEWRKVVTSEGYRAIQPKYNVNKTNVATIRGFSLAGALSARMKIRYKMDTEKRFDHLVYEYSCDAGHTYRSNTHHALSGRYLSRWYTLSVSLNNCVGDSSVRIRIMYQSDFSNVKTTPPILDYVLVEKYQ